jgi:FAD/FMN-containing dehydrogenase/Fe-S oxidoreductase
VLINHQIFQSLQQQLKGKVHTDKTMRSLYATDASIYREMPMAVVYPDNEQDIKELIAFANKHRLSLIPRTAGTSLAGQCVGGGIVVDFSKNFTKIIEINKEEGWVRLQPGVVRDELNIALKPFGWYFGPNTSTANRAMIGGMVANNSCGSYSIVYGSTRDHVLEIKALLSDGSEVVFTSLNKIEFNNKCQQNDLEGSLYRQINELLGQEDNRNEIKNHFPNPSIHRRNTGYAIDVLIDSSPFEASSKNDFNFCKMIAGSEGSLCIITEIKLHLNPLPPRETVLICAHFNSIHEAMLAVPEMMTFQPRAVELMDKIILDCTKDHAEYSKYRFFVEGDPAAIIVVEVGADASEELRLKCAEITDCLHSKTIAYAMPLVIGAVDIRKVWKLREAGLGLLSNFPGDSKPVAVIEDTAVELKDLPAYIDEFTSMMDSFGQKAVYYAHAGAGELHLRPVLNLKTTEGVVMLRKIATASAELIKKYNGSLSGEHGDGRLRAEFIPLMIGEKNHEFIKAIKANWDPNNIFNPGKIVNAPPMDTSLRYTAPVITPSIDTLVDFSNTDGILRAAEKCNGSGDCRKAAVIGGTMCPSYMATKNEKDTTRARANILREFLTHSDKKNRFDHQEIYEVMDLCMSCKGCKSECPSNVDMAMLKAEFTYQYQKSNGIPFRSWVMANITKVNYWGSFVHGLYNFTLQNSFTSNIIKNIVGVAPQRDLPLLYKTTLRKWFAKNRMALQKIDQPISTVYFFVDEFTDYNDVEIGIKAIQLLHKLGYKVEIPRHTESGRSYISKGLLAEAKKCANTNILLLKDLITAETPLLGVEPSCILGFRDEYPKLVEGNLKIDAEKISKYCLLIDEFIAAEIDKGNIVADSFTTEKQAIMLHGHCHQKAISTADVSVKLLSLPQNYTVEQIPSGCCGMAGSFGYEKEHYEISMNIGELVLFPAIRKGVDRAIVAAPGTSCRHQIKDGTGVRAKHPVEILFEALK